MALICKQLRPIDIPAQESVCKGPNLHRSHIIWQGVAEDPWLMHRVKKVAFCTRPQFVMTFRVSNAPFFTRNNSHLDLSRLYHTPRLVNENQECCFLPLSSFGTPEEHFLYHTVCPGIFDKQEGLRPYIFLFNKANGDHSSKYKKSYVPKTASLWQIDS